jgi:hypothetical protein
MTALDSASLGKLLHQLPEWIRSDLGAKDQNLRTQAEEALAAMIMAELREGAISQDVNVGC